MSRKKDLQSVLSNRCMVVRVLPPQELIWLWWIVSVVVVVLAVIAPVVDAVPLGFVDEGIISRVAITGTFAPNPRKNGQPMLLLSGKEGQIHVLEDPDTSDKDIQIADIQSQMCTNGERGLQSIVTHPNFIQNRYIYLFYTEHVDGCPESTETGPSNRLSRFTMNADTLELELDSEVIVLQTPSTTKRVHNGGAMAFGNDGFLYVTTGDAGTATHASDLSNLFGKLLRINVNGIDSGNIIPPTNPFVQDNAVPCGNNKGKPPSTAPDNAICAEIYAYGFRNPFRLAMDYTASNTNKVRFAIGDVGASVWEELSWGGSDYAGTNYGWPTYEGPCTKGSDQKCPLDTAIHDPFYYYEHISDIDGGCIVGGTFVPRSNATTTTNTTNTTTTTSTAISSRSMHPQNVNWPPEYQYLFIDFVFGKIYNLIADPDRECRTTCIPPIPAYRNETFHKLDDIVDMFFGPYGSDTDGGGALYVVSRGDGQNIRRIRYTGGTNHAPMAVISTTPATQQVQVGDVIEFRGEASSDPDNDPLTYLWDLGDGTKSTEMNFQHTYNQKGEYTVTLTVSDRVEDASLSQSHQVFVLIVVGTPPIAHMISPPRHSTFVVGQVLTLEATAVHGTTGEPLDNTTQIFWEVKQHHGDHFHPFLDKTAGNPWTLQAAPEPEDFKAANTSYLEIILVARDGDGLTTTISRNIQPHRVSLRMDSVPRGLEILVDEFAVTTPATITSWGQHNLRLNVLDQPPHYFASWSMGPGLDAKTIYKVPVSGNGTTSAAAPITTLIATFTSDSTEDDGDEDETGNSPFQDLSVPPSSAPTQVPSTVPTVSTTTVPPSAALDDNNVILPTEGPTPVDFVTTPTPVPSELPTTATTSTTAPSMGTDNGGDEDVPVELNRVIRDCSATEPCGPCEGDCDTDDDCEGSLICFQKEEGDGDTVIPGCIGTDSSRTDWCITAPVEENNRRSLQQDLRRYHLRALHTN